VASLPLLEVFPLKSGLPCDLAADSLSEFQSHPRPAGTKSSAHHRSGLLKWRHSYKEAGDLKICFSLPSNMNSIAHSGSFY